MRVLITGATGFVGGWLANEIADAYPDSLIFGTAYRSSEREALPVGTIIRPVDLNDVDQINAFVAEAAPDCVFHLAGYASGAGTDREAIFRVNVDGTRNLLKALAKQGRPCRVQLASSGYVYGETMPGRPAQENDTLAPHGPYAESKKAMEEMARSFSENGLLSFTVTRSFNHTGPGQGPDFVVPAFARQIVRIEKGLEEASVKHGNLDALRDFVDVRDVVRAYRLLLFEVKPVPWHVINVASGQAITIRAILRELIAMAQTPVTEENDPARMRPSDLPECIGDPSLLQALTGWRPEVARETMLRDTLEWWRQQAV